MGPETRFRSSLLGFFWGRNLQLLLTTPRRKGDQWKDYPTAQKVILVCDNLNTHKPAALYKTFRPQEAKRLLNRLEIHHTPKHGSWLNMAEIELAALTRQCLDRRIEDLPTLQSELAAWKRARNATGKTISWQFTTADARIKLERLYPVFND